MRCPSIKVAAAVAVAIGGHSIAHSAPSFAQCATAGAKLYIAGSPVAQPFFIQAATTDLFDPGGVTLFSATNGDFKAYCGSAKAGNGAGIAPGTIITVYYRGEADSVVGALPIVSGKPIKMLDISPLSCQVAAPPTAGTSGTVGTTDGWSGCVTTHNVEMGITDLEPTVFVPPNYPSPYSPTVFGTATKSQLAALTSTPLVQQLFAFYVNTSGINGRGTGQAIDLTYPTAFGIITGNITDWNQVPAAGGGVVSTTSVPITLVNREPGAGSRAALTTHFLGTNCVTFPGALFDITRRFSTRDALALTAATPGAITYASIDQSDPSLSIASLMGVAPSNLAATSGHYKWWYEATAQLGVITSPGGTALYNWLVGGELQNVATAPHEDDILAIPNIGTNVPTVPAILTANALGGHTIYINPFSRLGNSCNPPQ
jgi:PBP superfamily domain